MGQHAHGGLQQGQHAFEQGAFQQAPTAAVLLLFTPHEDCQYPQHAGQEQHAQRPGPQRQQFGGQDVPVGQHWRARHPQGGAQRHEGQPQRGRQVGHGTRHEHGAVHGVDAGLGHQACVLQVALAPAAVALQFGQQVGRLLLVAAHQVGHQPHVVARAAHEGGFHKVVAHDAARQAPFAGDGRERAVLHEGFHADDGVVPPVMRFTQLPELHAQREQAAGDARGELLRTRVQRDVANGLRSRLDDACRRVGFHELGHGDDAVAAHHAVGVQHHHVAVVLAPAAAEVGHIACLAVGAALAQAVVHLHLRLLRVGSQCHAQVFPGSALGAGNIAVVAVGQHEHVKRLPVAGGRHRFAGGAQPGKHGGHVFVADGHDDGGARVGRQCVARHAAGRERMLVAAQHDPKTHHPGHEAGHHPGREQGKQGDLPPAQPCTFIRGLHLGKQHAGQHRAAQHQQDKGPAAALGGGLPGLGRGGGFCAFYSGCAACQRACHAFPETLPRQRRHRSAVHRWGRHAVGMAHFAHGAARSGGLRVRAEERGVVGVMHRRLLCLQTGCARAYSGRMTWVHVSLTACWRC